MFTKLLVLFVLLTIPAFGQDITHYRLPEGHRLTVSGETYQGFNLGEYRQLLHMDEDLHYLTDLHTEEVAQVGQLTTAITNLQGAITLSETSINTLQTENARLSNLWSQENLARHNAEASHGMDWFPWLLAGGFGIATVILVLVLALVH